jgi:hypothetical protein
MNSSPKQTAAHTSLPKLNTTMEKSTRNSPGILCYPHRFRRTSNGVELVASKEGSNLSR